MKIKNKSLLYGIFGALVILALVLSYKSSSKHINTDQFNIEELSSEQKVIPYLKRYNKLPNYYITKKEARSSGWKPQLGNLCKELPGRIIGGDNFSNREKKLPYRKERKWKEADLNYKCGKRGADRIVFSNDGLIYITYDHYNTFEKK